MGPSSVSAPVGVRPAERGPVACRAGQLRASLGVGSGVSGGRATLLIQIALAVRAAPCILRGVPRVELLDVAGRLQPTTQTATSLSGGSPVALEAAATAKSPNAPRVRLAYAGVRWNVCAGDVRPASVRMVLPGGAGDLTLSLGSLLGAGPVTPCGATLDVGPFVPAGTAPLP